MQEDELKERVLNIVESFTIAVLTGNKNKIKWHKEHHLYLWPIVEKQAMAFLYGEGETRRLEGVTLAPE